MGWQAFVEIGEHLRNGMNVDIKKRLVNVLGWGMVTYGAGS